jgi:hypothetical protein
LPGLLVFANTNGPVEPQLAEPVHGSV